MLSSGVIILLIVVFGIWILIEVKRLKHKIFAVFLIALILFTYVSFFMVVKDDNLNLKTIDGISKATKIYFLWLGSAFGNMKSITLNAVKMDWSAKNITEEKDSS